ncbi:MAG: hypothetical protein IH623_03240 [Verrucomicrobia bacterium]|nr:hypothetical protein [Verrucomicrobiota bacterium]
MNSLIIIGIVILVPVVVGLVFFSRLRARAIVLILSALMLLYAGVVLWFSHRLDRTLAARDGARHVFQLANPATILTEQLAIQKARAALARDGHTQDCHPVPDGRSTAPDGGKDVYLVRNTMNPNFGHMVFTNASGDSFYVAIEFVNDRITCQRIVLK